jgi:predicted DNA-binding transcriptional regulator AlpA
MSADLPTLAAKPHHRRLRPITARRKQSARLLSLSLAAFDRAVAAGTIPPGGKIGSCRVWCIAELESWAAHGFPSPSEWVHCWPMIRDRR